MKSLLMTKSKVLPWETCGKLYALIPSNFRIWSSLKLKFINRKKWFKKPNQVWSNELKIMSTMLLLLKVWSSGLKTMLIILTLLNVQIRITNTLITHLSSKLLVLWKTWNQLDNYRWFIFALPQTENRFQATVCIYCTGW